MKKRVQSKGCAWYNPSEKQSLLGGVVGTGGTVVMDGSSTQSTSSAVLQKPIRRSNSKPFPQTLNVRCPITHSMNWLQNWGWGRFCIPNGEHCVHVELLQVWLTASNNKPGGHLSPRIVCPFMHIMYASHDSGDAAKLARYSGAPKQGRWPCTALIVREANRSASEIITKYECQF